MKRPQKHLTEFELAVLNAVAAIPPGKTRTYEEIANAIGRKGAARAVGNALGKNPLPIIIPCHRVIRKDGSPGGYSFAASLQNFATYEHCKSLGKKKKEKLLKKEKLITSPSIPSLQRSSR